MSLVLDAIRASGGVAGSGAAENSEFLAGSFPDLVAGMQCARRIQWAVEGLSENEPFRGAAAAILVDVADEAGSPGPTILDWEGADPGKILLKRGASGALDAVPGVSLGGATAAGSREWAWRSLAANAGFAADEQVVLGMLRAAGRSDPGAARSMPAGADTAMEAPTRIFASAAATSPERPAETYRGDTTPGAGRFLRMPVVAGAVGVLLVVVVAIFFFARKTPVQSAAPSPAAVPQTHPGQSTAPATPQPVVPAPAATGHTNSAAAAPKRGKQGGLQKNTAVPDQNPPPPPVVSHCDLTEGDIQRSLARADLYMSDGDLSDARAAYQHVVGCPSARERAQAGLIRIQKIAAQRGSPN